MTDSVEQPDDRESRRASWIGLWIGLLILGAWLRWPVPWLLVVPPALVLERVLRARRLSWGAAAGCAVLLAGSVAGFTTHYQLHRIQNDWERIWEIREERAAETLGEELDGLVESGETATEELVRALEDGGGTAASPPAGASSLVGEIRDRYDLEAMAVYGPDGNLEVWDGVHRGTVPTEARFGEVPFAYGERPLFSYLYFTRTIPSTGGTVVGAYLLNTALPPGLEDGGDDFVSRVEARTGEELTISRSERMIGESVWDFRWEDTRLFSVAVVEPRRSAERDRILLLWGRILAMLVAVGWIALAVGEGNGSREVPVAAAALVSLAILLPLGRVAGSTELDSPGAFLLASPVDATLLRTLVVGGTIALAAGMLWGWLRGRGDRALGPLPVALSVGLGFPMVVRLFRSAPSPSFVVESETPFVLMQVALALALGFLVLGGWLVGGTSSEAAGSAAREGSGEGGRGSGSRRGGAAGRRWLFWGGLAAAGALSVGAGALVAFRGSAPLLVTALWALPAAAVVVGRRSPGGASPASVLIVAGVLGATCALPFAWETRVRAQMELGEAQLGRLDTAADPYTEFLLQRFATRVDSLDRAAVGPVELLYGGWVQSGMAEEGIPAWLTLWSAGDLPLEDLRIGVPPPRPTAADEFLAEARISAGPVITRLRRPDVRYVAVVPLTSGSAVTAVVPPRSVTPALTSLEPLFGGGTGAVRDPLQLVPLLPEDVPAAPDTTVWRRTASGWRGERTLDLPDGRYHAHYQVELAGPTLLGARATLLLVLDLTLLGILFGGGRMLASGRPVPARRLFGVFRSFQGRVTVALFGFFLLSVGLLGILGYRTLSGAAERTATALADRVVDEAAGWYLEVQGAVDLLARRVGSDLLEYQDGRLSGGSASEMVELGLYEGWLPYPVHAPLERGDALTGAATRSVGSWEYVVAYRRMPDGTVLGAPVPLEAGAAALRRREMLDLLGFAVLLGGALSLGLAYLVGRTLARPIRELRSVTARVGRGDLEVHLPEERLDEFAAVFEDFNRMVVRLRRAREDLLHTTRRTQAIIDEAATGVVALSPEGEVTLVNPRAEDLLRTGVEAGVELPRRTSVAEELAEWVDAYLRDGLHEGSTEIHDGERRIRVQARRISGRDRLGGLVLSLEDVADELRTERILAWGEMAQQVAHEVKNPLTPIKLGVQHIRRAWEDQRPDFAEILRRNVDATLAEIDRLASIARSFSRFAAPETAGEAPLVPVDLATAVEETLDLYSMDEGRIRFDAEVPDAVPPVRSRASEIKEVLVNLLENARSAMEDGGVVRVEVEPLEEGVELRVRDDGPGIPDHLLPRIFEPHFSTRSSGTGLGLAIVRRLVESWGGTVTAESRVGEGTVVSILVPRWRHDADGPGEPGAVSTV